MAGGCKVRSVLTNWPDSLSRNSTFYKWIKQVIFFNARNIKQNMAHKKQSGNTSGHALVQSTGKYFKGWRLQG